MRTSDPTLSLRPLLRLHGERPAHPRPRHRPPAVARVVVVASCCGAARFPLAAAPRALAFGTTLPLRVSAAAPSPAPPAAADALRARRFSSRAAETQLRPPHATARGPQFGYAAARRRRRGSHPHSTEPTSRASVAPAPYNHSRTLLGRVDPERIARQIYADVAR